MGVFFIISIANPFFQMNQLYLGKQTKATHFYITYVYNKSLDRKSIVKWLISREQWDSEKFQAGVCAAFLNSMNSIHSRKGQEETIPVEVSIVLQQATGHMQVKNLVFSIYIYFIHL